MSRAFLFDTLSNCLTFKYWSFPCFWTQARIVLNIKAIINLEAISKYFAFDFAYLREQKKFPAKAQRRRGKTKAQKHTKT